MCDISLIGTKKYEGELEEESGWTSYLETDYSNASVFSESSTIYSNGSNTILNGMHKYNIGEDNYRLVTITTCNSDDDEHNIVARNGNIEEGANYIKGIREAHFPDEELESSNYNCVHASSTFSDASSSFSTTSSPIIISKKSFKRFYPKLHQIIHPNKLLKDSNHDTNQYKRISHAAADYLEDTATSSPSSALVNANERQQIFYEEGTDAVSTRFKALEALIPRLKEVAGKGKEDEMVKVIERHVRDLELKVELLSSAWKLAQLKHQ